ncbi:hypothetical protein ABC970_22230 [Bacillus licheniformis]|uniref:hypothetical protein n=1 Tax=Bacillus TaxID=1386 RepID=UPI00046E8D87|nr:MULTISPECIES: hypothetical protein [Bacillus]ASK26223.1 hypothetical protein BSSX_p0032 [Bacillus subtilis]MCQ5304569.1 hypothetical protein [Bacillus licheniformis]MDM5287383.1 hypothetical protein [Bacillus licheniformis]MEC0776927.1 hypothetical protein [Bacillus licheniformis]MED1661743.1 hypothetical protein [Bacillus licheniformis]
MKITDYHVDIPETGSLQELADRYIDKIERGFNLNNKEIAAYLNVSVLWVKRHIKAEYIWLNKRAKDALNEFYPNHPRASLFRNHKLYKRSDVFSFLTGISHYCLGDSEETFQIENWPKKLLSPTKAAEKFECTNDLLNRRIRKYKIKKYFVAGNLPRYNENDLNNILSDYLTRKHFTSK